jgi:hypothetical protein
LATFGICPSVQHPPARERKRMRAVSINDGELKIPVERRRVDWLPHQK